MNLEDTIVAISSASAPAARMIVRTSGPAAVTAALAMATDAPTAPASAGMRRLAFAGLVCPAWVYVFRGPRSYTGDDLVEYHLPGNPVLAKLLVEHLRAAGLRAAEPGEFTARAYFNGRIDLTEAEGVAATIAAGSEQELAAARRLLAGELARRLAGPTDAVAEALALLEVGIDFADEDVTFLSSANLRARITAATTDLRALLAESARFEPLAHEPTFVLVGRPNAGKSTLLNALAGYERAVASPEPGTTRDALEADVVLGRGRVRVIDVAGLEAESTPAGFPSAVGVMPMDLSTTGMTATGDPQLSIRRQMQERALRAVAEADLVVLVRPYGPAASGESEGDGHAWGGRPKEQVGVFAVAGADGLTRPPDLIVLSKTDLGSVGVGNSVPSSRPVAPPGGRPVVCQVSAMTGEGMGGLRQVLDELAFGRGGSEAKLALNARHVAAVSEAVVALDRAAESTSGPAELTAAELRSSLDALGRVRGQISPDELLGRIFGKFCIGK